MSKEVTMADEFDKTEVYDKQIKPLIKKITDICLVNDMPIFFSCAVKNEGGATEYEKGVTVYKRDGVLPGSNNINLYDDWFRLYLLIGHMGLTVTPTTKFAQFNEESLGSEIMDYITNTSLEDEAEELDENIQEVTDVEEVLPDAPEEKGDVPEKPSIENVLSKIFAEAAQAISRELKGVVLARDDFDDLKASVDEQNKKIQKSISDISDSLETIKKSSDGSDEASKELEKIQDELKTYKEKNDKKMTEMTTQLNDIKKDSKQSAKSIEEIKMAANKPSGLNRKDVEKIVDDKLSVFETNTPVAKDIPESSEDLGDLL
ncbi:MAG: hypothetical protein J6I68_00565 [Butyrivibrio sp.]|uniref:hypothetical protein n=1 Tax=Butyrivibrio sp. TaxID=28121 RepID=UPI001B490317|nr:hypothetical protein [Butyrivibrio sp.]MBP3781720.1 hypothetical protein [Butyrivibrio sp.]